LGKTITGGGDTYFKQNTRTRTELPEAFPIVNKDLFQTATCMDYLTTYFTWAT